MDFIKKLHTDLECKNITVTFGNRPILRNINYKFSRRMTCILGASGSGKTTLLKILGGRNFIAYDGSVLLSGVPVSKRLLREKSGFVYQNDLLPEYLTVDEYQWFCSLLKPFTQDDLGLEKTGKTLIKKISGGERKRLSVSIEMGNQLLFLDEPTSGLDMATAYRLVSFLKARGIKVVATIHQPSTHLLALFDDLVVLHEGRIFYGGPVNGLENYLMTCNFVTPEGVNPADFLFTMVLPNIEGREFNYQAEDSIQLEKIDNSFIMESNSEFSQSFLVSENNDENDSTFITPPKQKRNQRSDDNKKQKKFGTTGTHLLQFQKPGFWKIFTILLWRQLKMSSRNPFVFIGRIFQSLTTVLFISAFYYNIPGHPESLQMNARGYFYFLLNYLFFGTTMGCVHIFYDESKLFSREYQENFYSIFPLFLSKVIVDTFVSLLYPCIIVPSTYEFTRLSYGSADFWSAFLVLFLITLVGHSIGILFSSAIPDISTTLVVLPSTLLPIVTISGFQVVTDTLIKPLKILQYISPTRYAFSVLEDVVYNNLGIDKDGQSFIFKPKPITTFSGVVSILISMYLINLVLSYFFLKKKFAREV